MGGDSMLIPKEPVAVIGKGRLAEFVCKELTGMYTLIQREDISGDIPIASKLVLVLSDNWHSDLCAQAEEKLRYLSLPWMIGFATRMEGVAGPLIRPRIPGCSQCADLRRLTAGRDREEINETQLSLLLYGTIRRDEEIPSSGLKHMAFLLAEETHRFMQGMQLHTEGQLYLVDLKTMECSLHSFLPDPTCETCGQMPDDSPLSALLSLQSSPKVSSDYYRCIPADELQKDLLATYFDEKTGLMNRTMNNLVTPFADVVINFPSPLGDEAVGGRSNSFKASETTAILEGLERLCGMAPRGKKSTVVGSFSSLSDRALDPVSVGVYSKEQYASPDFPFEPFDPECAIQWVWGHSFLRECPILIPEQLAYYSGGCGFVHEFSNGCAVGGSLEEAVFYGILEVVERDSFLMTWYGKLQLSRLNPLTVADVSFRLMVERMEAVTGYEVLFFNSTMEHGIPSIWAVAKNKDPEGANLLCSAGAHVDPIRAAKSAMYELAASIPKLEAGFKENKEALAEMLRDPYRVEEMEHHALLYSMPEAEERLSFLLKHNRPPQTFADEFKQPAGHKDMRDELQDLLKRFLDRGHDVIVIDQTSPEISRKGLHCVKVLIPGMLPMSFGYKFTRLTGLERVLRVPMELGYRKDQLTEKQLNKHPHPFL
jgi:ribosomal protein S12 methylthiotransferase accessory factor